MQAAVQHIDNMAGGKPGEMGAISGTHQKKARSQKDPHRGFRKNVEFDICACRKLKIDSGNVTTTTATERNFGYEQAQSLRWLQLHFGANARKKQGREISDTHLELFEYFKSPTLEERNAGPELSDRSKAIVENLEAERDRSRNLQGGVANANDWFLTPAEQSDLVSLMRKATVSDGGKGKGNGKFADAKVQQRPVEKQLPKSRTPAQEASLALQAKARQL